MSSAPPEITRERIGAVARWMVLALAATACGSTGPTGQPAASIGAVVSTTAPPLATMPAPEPSNATIPTGHLNWADLELPSFGDEVPILLAAGGGTPRLFVALSAAGTVWRSIGGIDWDRAADLRSSEGDANRMTALVFDGRRFLAFGSVGSSAASSIRLAAYTQIGGSGWTSVDGRSWSAIKLPAGVRVDRIDLLPNGMVGLGGAGDAPVAVSSPDGLAWSAHIVAPSGGFLPTAVIGLKGGGYLAAGAVTDGTCPEETGVQVWSSTDLDSWSHVPGADLGCGTMDMVFRGPAGYLGLGHTLTPEISEPLSWFSVDGRAWGPATVLGFNVLTGGLAPDGTFLALGEGIWESMGSRGWARSVDTGLYGVFAYADGLALSCAGPGDCRSWRIARIDGEPALAPN